jgi:hypothetical protein
LNETTAPLIETLQAGSQFRQYRLLEHIGFGGQGVIWSACDQPCNRVVAIKFMQLPELDPSSMEVENRRFEHQAGLISRLHHRHILPLDDFGTIGRLRYMVMPYIAAGSLQDLRNSTPLSLSETLGLFAQIGGALHYLHQNQIVHRDLKPTNVLVDYRGNTYLADFGLARLLSLTTQALHTGRGTPPYASPEQHTASKMTPQSDVYSLGILLYELLTKEPPWHGEKLLGIEQLADPSALLPDPRQSVPEVPADLVAALWTLTAANPSQRPPDVPAAVELVLASAAHDEGAWRITGPSLAADDGAADPTVQAQARIEEAGEALRRSMAVWHDQAPGRYALSLTRFVLVDDAYAESGGTGLPMDAAHCLFMLQGAMLYGQRRAYWWAQVPDLRQKLALSAALLAAQHVETLEFVAGQLAAAMTATAGVTNLPASAVAPLLEAATELESTELLARLLTPLGRMVHSPAAWQKAAFNPLVDRQLAKLALSDEPYAMEACRLIGRVRSQLAVQIVLKDKDPAYRLPALAAIRESAGSLPPTTPAVVQLRVRFEVLIGQLTARPEAVLKAYFLTALGSLLGVGAHVYLTYSGPSQVDVTRLLVSLGRGAFLGALLGLGVFFIQLICRRFQSLAADARVVTATLGGGLLLFFAFFSYNVLFLDVLPWPWLIAAVSLMLAAGLSLSAELVKARWLRAAIDFSAITLALTIAWGAYLLTGLQPLLVYGADWPVARVLVLAGLSALPLAALANVTDLGAEDNPG